MTPISGVNTAAAQPLAAAEEVLGAPKVRKPEEEVQGRQPEPVVDEYVPEEPQEPSGRYWPGRDEEGQPKIFFDDPEREPDPPESPEKSGEGEKRCAVDTGKVDREIEKLKKKQQELERRISTETDEAKRKDLERQLVQVERELKQKDNDTYRKQHAAVSAYPKS